jgi:hypothetical protein
MNSELNGELTLEALDKVVGGTQKQLMAEYDALIAAVHLYGTVVNFVKSIFS